MARLKLEYLPVKSLKAWGKNPRKNDIAAEKLTGLIEAHGFINLKYCQLLKKIYLLILI